MLATARTLQPWIKNAQVGYICIYKWAMHFVSLLHRHATPAHAIQNIPNDSKASMQERKQIISEHMGGHTNPFLR